MPQLGGFPSEYCHAVCSAKPRMVWLPDGEKFFEDMFIRFETMHECDGHTDTHTHRHCMTAKAALAQNCAAKNCKSLVIVWYTGFNVPLDTV